MMVSNDFFVYFYCNFVDMGSFVFWYGMEKKYIRVY